MGLDDGAGGVDADLAGLGNTFFDNVGPSAAHDGSLLTELDGATFTCRFFMNGAAVTFASS